MPHFNYDLKRRALGVIVIGLGCGALHAQQPGAALTRDGLTAPDALVASTLPRYLVSRSASFVDWLLDGSMLIATRFGDTQQIHRLRAPLGMREQLTWASGGIAAAAVRPYASDALVYVAPLRGGEASQLSLQRLDDHAISALTDGSHRDERPLWAHDGKRIAFASNRRNGIDVDIYVLDTGEPGATPRLVVGGAGNRWCAYDWSIDDKRLLLGRELPRGELASAGGATPDSELFVAQVDSGEISAVGFAGTPSDEGSSRKNKKQPPSNRAASALHVQEAQFSTDGRGILLLTHATGTPAAAMAQFQRLAYIDFGGHDWRELSSDAGHDVEHFDRSLDGRYVAYTINDAGASRLMLIDQQRKLDLTIAALPAGIISRLKFDPSGKRLALTLESVRAPRDVYVLE
ncbi:MAG TPA: hypothetical protein VII41_08835, partial [Steroidobacteraceae bacterium]